MDVVDERSGRPLIRRVLRVSEHYQGPRLADLPDLLVDYDDSIPTGSTEVGEGEGAIVRVQSPKIGVVEGANTYGRTGEHRSQGLLVAAGPTVSPGAFARPISVLDLAPTWTRLLGVELGRVDGRAIEGLDPIS
jgi:predicted AlkP superfamily phosphohydrolase/phosphomutase